jgi:hypothetical protein
MHRPVTSSPTTSLVPKRSELRSIRRIALALAIAGATSFIPTHSTSANDPDTTVAPNYFQHIAPMLHERCVTCHREGQSAPFALSSYELAVEHATTMQSVMESGSMPPWKAADVGLAYAHERRLSEDQKTMFRRWIDADYPEGNAADGPRLEPHPTDWYLGTPDLVVRMRESFPVPAEGPDIYRSFVLPIDLPEDRWIRALEVRPSARSVMHHALFFVDPEKQARQREGEDGKPGFKGMAFVQGGEGRRQGRPRDSDRLGEAMTRGLGGYVPGATPHLLPGDLARHLPAHSDIVIQSHFHPTGKAENELTEVALYFADRAPKHQLVPVQIPPLFGFGAGIDIPAGESDFVIRDQFTLPIDAQGIEVGGHAHYLCTQMQLTATLPDGKQQTLLRIDDWDLDWQDQYLLAKPFSLPKGTTLSVEIHYDNSSDNPSNPFSPPRPVRWGQESTDEMGSMSVQVIAADESERPVLLEALQAKAKESIRNRVRNRIRGLRDRLLGN